MKETVYATLSRMERKGFVSARQERRPEGSVLHSERWYVATGEGRDAIARVEETLALRLKRWNELYSKEEKR